MALQIIINLTIAVLWMFLFEAYNFSTFFIGYLFGIFLLLILERFIPDRFYLFRVWAIIKLIGLFLKELILANIDVVKWAYKPKLDMKPGIIAIPIDLKTNWEITILANLITLTPGTLSVSVSLDYNFIYIHAMDVPDIDETVTQIKDSFEKAIMEVTR
ncbi:Na+/H+ antiporter subunit E [Pseudalkalibacillus caeni]|uniref:Na+/H+ antiporter subunit E n=1 Tax=Exobacillus caeni TaxID=2574798 RepID=A0A5R9FFF1_9BACL|nr:Na+/H+ antiporter subunit E [Pseudalkalibacillus caeni]TLS39324.1 Na+/H+ antiporter subunit E [Pseudalkalibacillus caeni]